VFPCLNVIKSSINDFFGNRLLAANHHVINELRYSLIVVLGIRKDFPFCHDATSWHEISPFLQVGPPQSNGRPYSGVSYLIFFAPYLERPCFLSLTPEVSSTPRIV
jgi:hypothetical protein